MAEKLSKRLEREAASWDDWGNDHPGEHPVTTVRLLREAAELARRVEGAATGNIKITHLTHISARGEVIAAWHPSEEDEGYQRWLELSDDARVALVEVE